MTTKVVLENVFKCNIDLSIERKYRDEISWPRLSNQATIIPAEVFDFAIHCQYVLIGIFGPFQINPYIGQVTVQAKNTPFILITIFFSTLAIVAFQRL